MSREEELNKLTVAELKAVCKEKNIPCYRGKNLFRKGEMVEAILEAENESVEEDKSAQEESEIEVETGEPVIADNKMKYIKDMQVGAIVAIRLQSGKVISAKVKKKSTKRELVLCETAYGEEHTVKWSDILWVRTKKTWPRGVYELFKKGVDGNGKEVESECAATK